MIEEIIYKIDEIIWGIPFLLILIGLGLYITLKLKIPQIKTIKSIFKISNSGGDATSFKSLMNILAGTLGIGNILGVASAIVIGGTGSIFWIFVSGFIAMATSYAENYLTLKYREKNNRGEYVGGAMYVLKNRLDNKMLSILFCIFTILASIGIGAMVQSNSLCSIIQSKYNIPVNILAIVISIILAYVIFNGKKLITKINSVVIPACTIIYVALCGMVIFGNFANIGNAISNILSNAFKVEAIIGGGVCVTIFQCISIGFSRGMFSNEAGMGSACMFTSCTDEKNNISTISHIMACSVFIDTILLCTLTGFTIVVVGAYNITSIPIMVERTFGILPFGNLLITFCMTFFALATVPCWEFYGEQAIKFLFNKNIYAYVYRFIYVIFIYIGCGLDIPVVWSLSSIFNACMAFPNIYMIWKLKKEIA